VLEVYSAPSEGVQCPLINWTPSWEPNPASSFSGLAVCRCLLLICNAVHNTMTSQQCNKNPYCMVVLHACIHAPMVRLQPQPKIVRSANAARNTASQPSIYRLHYYPHRRSNTRCATSDVNPFKIRCNLQITKATVNETQWWHVINDLTNDVKLTSAIGVVLK